MLLYIPLDIFTCLFGYGLCRVHHAFVNKRKQLFVTVLYSFFVLDFVEEGVWEARNRFTDSHFIVYQNCFYRKLSAQCSDCHYIFQFLIRVSPTNWPTYQLSNIRIIQKIIVVSSMFLSSRNRRVRNLSIGDCIQIFRVTSPICKLIVRVNNDYYNKKYQ